MSILIFTDRQGDEIKKASLEAISYGATLAKQLNTTATAVVLGSCNADLGGLGEYGADKVLQATNEELKNFDATVYTTALSEAINQESSDIIILAHNFNGKALGPMLSVTLKAGLISGAIDLPDLSNGFIVEKRAFSGKANAFINILTNKKIISLYPHAFSISKSNKEAEVATFTPSLPEGKTQLKETKLLDGEVPLSEAEIIVSGGRGLKGPENWGIIEDLAKELGAATACSRPVSDSGWRPNHEHVGQTGLTVRPNLYIAVGISGAIQHLAGVNGSKYMVVINKDPEAPFFKAANYGIIGDAFEVVPKLTEAIKKYKAEN